MLQKKKLTKQQKEIRAFKSQLPLAKKQVKTISKLKAEADKCWSLYVRYRDGWYTGSEWLVSCVTCPTTLPISKMQCGHFQSRKFNSTRFHELNTAAQCVGCNMFKQGEQYRFGQELDMRYGDGTAKEMQKLSQESHKLTRQELETIIEESKAYVEHCLAHPENYATNN